MDEETFESWIENALNIANALREFHSAPALTWCDECFEAAERQANACQEKKKSVGGNVNGKSGEHGQNLLYSEEKISDWVQLEDVIDQWYTMSDNYCFVKPGPTDGFQNLTQLLWVNSKKFGLAVSEDGHYIVANFFPAGNIAGQYVGNIRLPEYIVGEDVDKMGMVFGSFPPRDLIVKSVDENSWAQDSSVAVGDRFVAINDKLVSKMTKEEFGAIVKQRPLRLRLYVGVDPPPGEDGDDDVEEEQGLNMDTKRHGSIGRGKTELIADSDVATLGMVVAAKGQMEVRKVTPGLWADVKGIEPGDTFMKLNDTPAYEMTQQSFIDLVKNTRPLVFTLPNADQIATAIKIQQNIRGKQARDTVKSMKRMTVKSSNYTPQDWRRARTRAAKLEKEKDDKEKEAHELQMPRADVIAHAFIVIDQNRNKKLNEKEMFQFARGLDFPDSAEDWATEYEALCTEFNVSAADGFEFGNFQDLIDDDVGNPYYCGYDRLQKISEDIERFNAATKVQSIQRGRLARKRVANMADDADKQNAAATKIQAVRRGRQGRKQVTEMKAAKEEDKKKQEEDTAGTSQEEEKAREKAAVKIQAVERGKQGRKEANNKAEGNACTAQDTLTRTFQPCSKGAKLGILAYHDGIVAKVQDESQAKKLGIRPGMCFQTIDGEEYTETLLLEKKSGAKEYTVIFAGPQVFLAGSRIVVKAAFQGDDDNVNEQEFLKEGLKGVIKAIDEKGDADISFTRADGSTFDEFVLKNHLHKLQLDAVKDAKRKTESSGWFGGIFGGGEDDYDVEVLKNPEATAEEKEKAALRIQAAQRGKQGRKKADEKATEKAQEKAAVKIQAAERGKQGRKEAATAAAAAKKDSKQGSRQKDSAFKPNPRGSSSGSKGEAAGSTISAPVAAGNPGVKDGKVIVEKKVEKGPAAKATVDNKKAVESRNLGGKKDASDKSVQQKQRPLTKEEQEQKDAAVRIQSAQRGRGCRKDLDARKRAFAQFDIDKDGRMNSKEMLFFARFIGFDAPEEAWRQEWEALCAQHGWQPSVGLDQSAFVWLTTNPEEQYWFDASKLSDNSAKCWAAAAGQSDEEIKKVAAREMEVPMQAKISGIDWAKLEGNQTLKARVIERICASIAEKTGVGLSDLQVTLSPSQYRVTNAPQWGTESVM